MRKDDHYRRLLTTYLLGLPSHLDFWHETSQDNPRATFDQLGEYYLYLEEKASYAGPFDAEEIPLLQYRGRIGLQYNPIAIAQYGLAHFNQFSRTGDPVFLQRSFRIADWLVEHLECNPAGVAVWQHHFEWPYRQMLRPPWASALAQGQGISLLVRVAPHSKDSRYQETASQALEAFRKPVQEGGVVVRQGEELWLEEYLVDPPSHILNGAVAAAWGLYDYWLATADESAKGLFDRAICTLSRHLHRYDTGYWSLYELSSNGTAMLASPFYHRLHIVQLKVLHRMTGESHFGDIAARWRGYATRFGCRTRALWEKTLFKLRYY